MEPYRLFHSLLAHPWGLAFACPGTHWPKSLWVLKKGSKFYVWVKKGSQLFSLNIWKKKFKFYIFLQQLEKGGQNSIFFLSGLIKGVKITEPTYQFHWRGYHGGHVSYPTDSLNATRLGLCSSLLVHWVVWSHAIFMMYVECHHGDLTSMTPRKASVYHIIGIVLKDV